jgi:cupin superfamily acireductone dioxygenase involved in methionine salvage
MENKNLHYPSGSERKSLIYYPDYQKIVRSFLTKKEINEIISFIEKDTSEKLEVYDDQLFLTKRTDWQYHKNDKFKPYFEILKKQIDECIYENFTSSFKKFNRGSKFRYDLIYLDTWFAKSQKNSYVDTHDHGDDIGAFSFVCYLKIPSGESSLTFTNSEFSWKQRIIVKEGDILVFPSGTIHWSFDIEEERSIFSGNTLLAPIIPDEFIVTENIPTPTPTPTNTLNYENYNTNNDFYKIVEG